MMIRPPSPVNVTETWQDKTESGPKLMASFSSHWLKKNHHCQVFSKGLVGHIYERYGQNILLRGLDKVQEFFYRLYDSG